MPLDDEQIFGVPADDADPPPPRHTDRAIVVNCLACGHMAAVVNGCPRRCIACGAELPATMPPGPDVTR